MPYTDIISLSDAKDYLGVDDTSRDTEITRMIKSALTYMEKRTNHLLLAVDKDYIYTDGCVRVYDYPINTVVEGVEVKTGYSIYTEANSDITSITLNVGYETVTDIPDDLTEAAYIMLKFFFFEQDKLEEKGRVPLVVQEIINEYKRFII